MRVCVCLHSKDHSGLAARGPEESQPALGKQDIRATEPLRGALALQACIPGCHRPGPRGSCWADWVSPAAGRICTVHIYIYICSPADLHCAQPGSGAGWDCCVVCVCVPAVSVHLCDLCGCPCIYAHMWCICVLCVRMSTGNMCLASLQVGPGAKELWLPHLSWVVRSGPVSPINNLSRFACKLYFSFPN